MKIGFRLTDTQDEGVKFPVTIQNPFGTIDTEEIQLTEIVNPTFAEMVVGKINHIGKPSTSGGIEIWKMDECENKTYLFTLQAKEARPSYRQFTFPGCCPSLVVKAKKKFINYSEKDYGVEMDITSASGIRFAIQAIEHERNKKYNEYQAALKLARSIWKDSKTTSIPIGNAPSLYTMNLVIQKPATDTVIGEDIDYLAKEANELIDLLELKIFCMPPQQPMPVTHRFTDGMYIREIFIPKGNWLTSKVHNTEHPYVIFRGREFCFSKEYGCQFMESPGIGITTPGTRRVLYALEDTSWATFHPNPTNERDLEKIEEFVILKYQNQLLERLL